MSIYRDFAEILRCPEYVNLQRFYGARVCQFTEILWRPEYLNLQSFYGAPNMSIYRDFAEILRCPEYVNSQRFYGAPSMSIYRHFMAPRAYVNVQRFCRDFMVPRTLSIYSDFTW